MSGTEPNTGSMVAATDGQQRLEQDQQLAEQLVEHAKDKGLDLVGPDGVLTGSAQTLVDGGCAGHAASVSWL